MSNWNSSHSSAIGAEPFQQRGRFVVEIHEDQVAEALAAHLVQRAAGEIEIDEVRGIADGDQRAFIVVGPAVIFAGQPRALAARLGDDRRAAMAAGVVEGVHVARAGMDDDDRLP